MRPGDLVVAEGGKITPLWERPPSLHGGDTRSKGELSPGETALVVETAGRGTDVCVRVLSSSGPMGWNWESMFVVVRTR